MNELSIHDLVTDLKINLYRTIKHQVNNAKSKEQAIRNIELKVSDTINEIVELEIKELDNK